MCLPPDFLSDTPSFKEQSQKKQNQPLGSSVTGSETLPLLETVSAIQKIRDAVHYIQHPFIHLNKQ